MAEAPAPPFTTDVSEQARDTLARDAGLAARVNAVLLRAARPLRRRLDAGDNLALDVYGARERITVRVSLVPPDTVRIEEIAAAGPAPEGAERV